MADRSESLGDLPPLQRAYLKIVELQARLEAAERLGKEPIALIGMACRFPGGVANPNQYWQLLSAGRDAITEIPRDRWDINAFYSPDPQAPGKMYTRWGGFLANVDQFDPQFFSITPREAVTMDPQQRILLEVTWEALEHAGLSADEMKGSSTGVFTGTGFNDYARLLSRLDLSHIDAYSGSGIQSCFCTGRVSYVLGLQGPSIPVDTACSSSLVAIHQACRSLRASECDLALAGGVNLLLAPEGNIFLSKAGALSPDGRCKTFDEAANGFVRGEGCGVVVLKRYSDALSDGDNILALILGSAVNHDGRSSGLTVPNAHAQGKVIRQALKNSGIEPSAVSYIEAHGTGTPLGDPIEMKSLAAVFGRSENNTKPLLVASVKTNFGHLEAAAGIASLIKVVLMMQYRQIPAHLHFKKMNPHVSIDQLQVEIPMQLMTWQSEGGTLRTAGISSFGLSGTNAHIIVQEPPARPSPTGKNADRLTPLLLVLSAKKAEALENLAESYRDYLVADGHASSESLSDICYTAAAGRSHHDHRLVVVAKSKAETARSLEAFLEGKRGGDIFEGRRPLQGPPKLAFVFSGQGSQRAGMGRELLKGEPVFRSVFEQCDDLFRELADFSLIDMLRQDDASLLRQTRFSQPAIFSLQVALAALWRSWGIEPDAVIGHSLGEVAAAQVAGTLKLEDAVRLVYHRAKVMQQLTGKGRMAAVGLSMEAGTAFLSDFRGGLSIAAVNGPRSIVFSGDERALDEAMRRLRHQRVICRDLGVDYAFHSEQTRFLEQELLEAIGDVQSSPARLPIISTVTKRPQDGETFDARYWGRNMCQPVLFAQAVDELARDDFRVFLELSPQPVLQGSIAQCLDQSGVRGNVLPSLSSSESEALTLKKSIAQLYTLGYAIRWRAQFPEGSRRLSTLPSYPWQHQRYWVETAEIAVAPESVADDVRNWFYELRWIKQPPGAPEPQTSVPDAWLLLEDKTGIGRALAGALEARGDSTFCLAWDEVFDDALPSAYGLHQGVLRESLRRILEESGNDTWRGIIHLWSLDSTPDQETTESSLMRDQTLAVGTALHLIQTLAAREGREPLRLWFVTRGAQAVLAGTEPLEITQSPIWGLGRTCAAEFPALWGGLVDLDPHATESEAGQQILENLFSADAEDQIAFRNGERYVARVMRATPQEQKPFLVRPDASYLITGGRSGVGFEVARWLVRNGARTLVLMGRTRIPPPAEWNQISPEGTLGSFLTEVRELQESGVKIHMPSVDVSDEKQLRNFIDDYKAQGFAPIRGVFHAASVWKDAEGRGLVLPILHMDVASIQEVFPPKIVGGWLLQHLLGDSLDFLVLFSTGATIVGSAGQGNYAAANSFLDALAHNLNRKGGPRTLAVNWGPITDTGFGVTPEGKSLFGLWERRGIRGITPRQVLEALALLIPQDVAQMGVMRTDWELLKQTYSALLAAPWASELGLEPTDGSYDLLQILNDSPDSERKQILITHLQQQVSLVMGFRPEEVPEPQQGLFELGMDSLLALELKNRIQFSVKRDFPVTAVFDYPAVDSLAEYLLREILPQSVPETAEANGGAATDILEQIEKLSEEEVRVRLDQKIADGNN